MPTPLPPTYDQFVVSSAGVAAANAAIATGVKIDIGSFKVGAGGSGGATSADTDIAGALVYTGTPTAWNRQTDGTLDVICVIPPTLNGSFQEVTIHLNDTPKTMFARCAFSASQQLFSNAQAKNSYTLHCLLKLDQGTGQLSCTVAAQQPNIIYVDKWSNVKPPSDLAYVNAKFLIVQEPMSDFNKLGILTQDPLNPTRRWIPVNTSNSEGVAINSVNQAASSVNAAPVVSVNVDSDINAFKSYTLMEWTDAANVQHFRRANSTVTVNATTGADIETVITAQDAFAVSEAPVATSTVFVHQFQTQQTLLRMGGVLTGSVDVANRRSVTVNAQFANGSTLGGAGTSYKNLDSAAGSNAIALNSFYGGDPNYPTFVWLGASCFAGGGAAPYIDGVQVGHMAGLGGATSVSTGCSFILPAGKEFKVQGTNVMWLIGGILKL